MVPTPTTPEPAMSLQKYRADTSRTQPDGAVLWYAQWMGGPSLAKISRCRIEGTDKRATVYVTGQPDTWFSQPAATRVKGQYVGGYVTADGEDIVFHAMDRFKPRLAAVA
jgi:hypothetical protein